MSSFTLILLLGAACILAGFLAGCLTGHRVLRDVPSPAMTIGGIFVGVFGFFALVSYLGLLFYPAGLYLAGFGMGSAIRRSLLAVGK